MNKRVLVIAYEFPPVGGAGVQRVAKWVKYLPTFGWSPTVLTVSDPSVPVSDRSLLRDIPTETRIVTARTLEPGYAAKSALANSSTTATSGRWKRQLKSVLRTVASLALQPDPQCLWRPAALRAGLQELRSRPYDAILVTAPPFSSLILAEKLARRTGLPLVVDYRDEWTTCTEHWENRQSNAWTRTIQRRQQDRVLKAASTVIATTWRSVAAIAGHCRAEHQPKLFACIPNGFDPADFETHAAPPSDGPLRISYIGTLWNLTNVEPLVDAVRLLCDRDPQLASHLELVFAGRRTPAQNQFLDRLNRSPCRVIRHDYLQHCEALRLQQQSHVLTVLLSDLPEAPRIMPAKVFESMAAQRTILTIAPKGEVWETLSVHPGAACFEPDDLERLYQHLIELIERHRNGVLHEIRDVDLSRYDRQRQTQTLSELLDEVSGHVTRPDSSCVERNPKRLSSADARLTSRATETTL